MFYKASGPGVYDGGVEVGIDPSGRIAYDLKIRFGKMTRVKILGRTFEEFVGYTMAYSGSKQIDFEFLKEAYLQNVQTFELAGASFQKTHPFRFEFEAGIVRGAVHVTFDGIDPVDVQRVEIYSPKEVTLERC